MCADQVPPGNTPGLALRHGVCSRGSPLAMGPRLQLEVTRVGHGFEFCRSFATVTSTAAVTAKSTSMIGARIHI